MKAVIQPVKLCILKYGITKYIGRVAIATSIFFNTLFGGLNNQTVSARNYERRKQGLSNLCWIIDSILGEGIANVHGLNGQLSTMQSAIMMKLTDSSNLEIRHLHKPTIMDKDCTKVYLEK